MNLTANCSTQYRAVHNSGARPASAIKYLVLHATEGPTAEGAAGWFANPASGGSAHLVVDDGNCFRTLDDLVIPWAAPPLNQAGYHIEQAGFSRWSRLKWLAHLATIRRAAYKGALRCKRYGIPTVYVDAAGLKAGRKGVTTHLQISLAFHESDHSDPGTGYPLTTFMWLLRWYMRRV